MSKFEWISALLLISILLTLTSRNLHEENIELETKKREPNVQGGPQHSAGKDPETQRGRQERVDETAAKRWKEQSISDDHRAFELRHKANHDFDRAQDLMQDAAVLRHKLSRTTATEVQIKENLKEDNAEIARDQRELKDEKSMKKQYAGEAKVLEKREMEVKSKLAILKAAVDKAKVDEKHEDQQRRSVASLLKKATMYAVKAENGLKTSQELRLKSETNVGTGGDDTSAAREFEDSSTMKHRSKTWTHKALDLRSNARLAQEFVVILRHMVAKDDKQIAADKRSLKAASHAKSRFLVGYEDLKKKLRQYHASKIESDEQAATEHRQRDMAELKSEENRARMESREAGKDESRAMHLIHESHRLQGQAASALDASTQAIQNEEARA